MAAPTYEAFIAGVQEADIRALAFLTNANIIESSDNVEADAIKAQLTRLFQYEMINKPTEKFDRRNDGTIWRQFEARVEPIALNYIARAAMERVILSRDPIPAA